MYTMPPATEGEPTMGPPVLNVHFTPPSWAGPDEAYTPVRATLPWNVSCAGAENGHNTSKPTSRYARFMENSPLSLTSEKRRWGTATPSGPGAQCRWGSAALRLTISLVSYGRAGERSGFRQSLGSAR